MKHANFIVFSILIFTLNNSYGKNRSSYDQTIEQINSMIHELNTTDDNPIKGLTSLTHPKVTTLQNNYHFIQNLQSINSSLSLLKKDHEQYEIDHLSLSLIPECTEELTMLSLLEKQLSFFFKNKRWNDYRYMADPIYEDTKKIHLTLSTINISNKTILTTKLIIDNILEKILNSLSILFHNLTTLTEIQACSTLLSDYIRYQKLFENFNVTKDSAIENILYELHYQIQPNSFLHMKIKENMEALLKNEKEHMKFSKENFIMFTTDYVLANIPDNDKTIHDPYVTLARYASKHNTYLTSKAMSHSLTIEEINFILDNIIYDDETDISTLHQIKNLFFKHGETIIKNCILMTATNEYIQLKTQQSFHEYNIHGIQENLNEFDKVFKVIADSFPKEL